MTGDQGSFDFDGVDPQRSFGGDTFDADRDFARLKTQLGRVFKLMSDGRWRTLAEIQKECGGSEAACSARLRDLRKPKFGGHIVEHRCVKEGLWTYRLRTEPNGARAPSDMSEPSVMRAPRLGSEP
jgi:hypothetical protein